MSGNSSLTSYFDSHKEQDYKYPEGHISHYSPLGLPGNKRRSQKWSSVGNYPKWKEYGPTQRSAIKAINKEISDLLGDSRALNKFKNKGANVVSAISSIEVKIAILENIKKQALNAVSYIPYASEQIIPGVIGQSSDPIYGEGTFG